MPTSVDLVEMRQTIGSMNEDLHNEVEAINSIYGDNSLSITDEDDVYVLHLPQQESSLRLRFPPQYPAAPPAILGTQSSGENTRKGEAAHVLEVFRVALGQLYQPGEVCLFDVIEEVNGILAASAADTAFENEADDDEDDKQPTPTFPKTTESTSADEITTRSIDQPQWIVSDVIVELKSVFVARCAAVSSPDQARRYVQHLLDNDKKVRSATHNITAWRIHGGGENGIVYQDCDDDGETAAGGRLLHLMQLMDLWNVMVVVTRWYGGHQLGPKRFSIINTVARNAFVKGNFVREDTTGMKRREKR